MAEMLDQAAGLRRMLDAGQMRSVCFNGGRGDTGTTTVVTNLAVSLAQQGKRVLILDEHKGKNNVASRFGLRVVADLETALRRRLPLESLLLPGPSGVDVMQMSARSASLAALNAQEEDRLAFEFNQLTTGTDLILVDARAAASDRVPSLNLAAEDNVIVISNRAESITDAYGMIKLLSREYGQRQFRILINRAASLSEAQAVFGRVSEVTDRYIDVALKLIGFVPEDDKLNRANRLDQPVHSAFPRAESVTAFDQLAAAIDAWPMRRDSLATPVGFVHRLVQGSRALAEGVRY